jgi:hypothetical protein
LGFVPAFPKRKRKWISALLFAAGVLTLCFSPWAGATAGKKKEKVQYSDTRADKVYAVITTTEVDYFNVNNQTALTVMGIGVALSLALMAAGTFLYVQVRNQELALLEHG